MESPKANNDSTSTRHNMRGKLKAYLQRRYGVLPFYEALPDLETWLEKPLGQALLQQERTSIDQALGCLFGYHLMQLSISRKVDLVAASKINHRFMLSPCATQTDGVIHGQAQFDALPLPAESIDVALLHHVLDYSESPHQLLREASRVVIPRGHIVIVGFNPWSLLGSYKPFARLVGNRTQWRYHSLRLGRILDWLRLLDFEPVSVEHGFFRPPVNSNRVLKQLSWLDKLGKASKLPNGGYYCVVARKEITAMTPIRPVWQRLNPIVGLTVTKPSTRLPDPARARVRSKVR